MITESLGLARTVFSHGGRDQVNMQYTMGEVDMSARKLKESAQQRSQSIGMASVSDFVATVAMQMQTITFHLERGRSAWMISWGTTSKLTLNQKSAQDLTSQNILWRKDRDLCYTSDSLEDYPLFENIDYQEIKMLQMLIRKYKIALPHCSY